MTKWPSPNGLFVSINATKFILTKKTNLIYRVHYSKQNEKKVQIDLAKSPPHASRIYW